MDPEVHRSTLGVGVCNAYFGTLDRHFHKKVKLRDFFPYECAFGLEIVAESNSSFKM